MPKATAHLTPDNEQLPIPRGRGEFRPRKRAPSSPQARIVTGLPAVPINATTAGTIAELIVAADLMARGWSVFYPLVRTTRMDLIAVSENGERVRRIEVRCAKRSGSTVKFNTKHNAVCDNFAVVITGEPVIYDPDIGGGRGSS